MTSPCGEDFTCEDCGDRQACETYYAEKGFRLLEAQFEEDWHERDRQKRRPYNALLRSHKRSNGDIA